MPPPRTVEGDGSLLSPHPVGAHAHMRPLGTGDAVCSRTKGLTALPGSVHAGRCGHRPLRALYEIAVGADIIRPRRISGSATGG